ncbi:MAG: site-specific integrase [Pseudomonadota bacterium]
MKDYAEECARVLRPNTAIRYARALDLFLRYLDGVHGKGAPLPPALLTRRLLADWHTALKHGGLHGQDRQDATRRKLVEVVQLAWAWLYDNDESGAEIPPSRKIRMAREPATPTVAPTWAEMDACIGALDGWQHDLAILLRFTGLRVQQAMYLTWDDLDLGARVLRVRGELGKSPQERRGRVVPVSPHLADALEGWPRAEEPWLVISNRYRGGDRERMARARDVGRAWARVGVRDEAWKGRPHHAFRKGFVSELRRAGADADAVEYLVGHSLGLRGIYTDPNALPLEQAVALIPPLPPDLARSRGCEGADQPRFEGLDPHDPRPIREITLDTAGRHARSPRCPSGVPRRRRVVENVVYVEFSEKDGGGGGSRTCRSDHPKIELPRRFASIEGRSGDPGSPSMVRGHPQGTGTLRSADQAMSSPVPSRRWAR